jgi:hypothetical protein
MTWKEATKLTPFIGTDLEWHGKNQDSGCQRILLKSGQIDRYWSFMTPPGSECTSEELEKPVV